jgi:hypothetical protein
MGNIGMRRIAQVRSPHADDWLRSGPRRAREVRGAARIVFAAALSMVTSAAPVFHGGRVVAQLSVHNSRGGGAFEARDTNVGRHRHVNA